MGRPKTLPRFDFMGIYQILNLVTGKRYVGQAQNISTRIYEHRRRRNGISCYPETLLYKSIEKYGWKNFQFSVLEKVSNLKELNQRECFWISVLKTTDRKIGYNIRIGGTVERGWQHSDATRQKMSLAKQNYSGGNNPFFGKHHTEETKRKIGLANRGRKWTKEQRAKITGIGRGGKPPRPVFQIDKDSQRVIQEWPSITSAAKELNVSQSEIVMVANQTPRRKKRGATKIYFKKSAGGFRWAYA